MDSDDDSDELAPPHPSDDEGSDFEDDATDSPDDIETSDPIYLAHTRRLKLSLERSGDTAQRVRRVLNFMETLDLNTTLFLDALFWGNAVLVGDKKAQYERASLMHSEELPGILQRWHRPPREHGRGKRTRAARQAMESWAVEAVGEVIDREMTTIAPILRSPKNSLSKENLTSISLDKLGAEFQSRHGSGAPHLWFLLHKAAYSKNQVRRNSRKDPTKIIMFIISLLSYTRSHHCNRLIKTLSVYLHTSGLSARAFDTLHVLGVTMSHRWTHGAIVRLSDQAMGAVRAQVRKNQWFISHDNLNLAFRVLEQRVDNQSRFECFTGATVYIIKNPIVPTPDNRRLVKQRAQGLEQPISPLDIMDLDDRGALRVRKQMVHLALQFLVDSPAFDFENYPYKDSAVFRVPVTNELPCGPEHVTSQYVLRTSSQEEATYDGTGKLIWIWFQQLGLDTEDEQVRTAIERIIAWCGDQLTVDRLRGLFKFRGQDFNSFDRMDWIIPVFGWFHLQIAFAHSLHSQYLGTSAGTGFAHAFSLLQRKGLQTTSTKGPFHHNLEEALYHIGAAHVRSWWMTVSRMEIASLRKKKPRELERMAEIIVAKYASTEALREMDSRPPEEQDEVQRQAVMETRDLLAYFELDNAIKVGDVGRMEDMLPHLLYRFMGGRNSKYTIEILELLQGLHKEWPTDTREWVTKCAWLVNFTGKRNGFLAVDLAQEHNIRELKKRFNRMGPNRTFENLEKESPSIPTMQAVHAHLEKEFNTVTRGKKHTSPEAENDIVRLTEAYDASRIHEHCPQRAHRSSNDRAQDIVAKGALNVVKGDVIQRWVGRRSYERSTAEEWADIVNVGRAGDSATR